MKASASAGAEPPFCGPVPGVALAEGLGAAAAARDLVGDGAGQPGVVDGLDGVEQRHGALHLVALQAADEVQPQIRMVGLERRPFCFRFLDPVLAEHAVPGGQRRTDDRRRMGLGDGDQRDRGGRSPGLGGGGRDPRLYLFEIIADIRVWGHLRYHAPRMRSVERANDGR